MNNEIQSTWDLKKKLMDEHGELYRKFTTLILSLTAGAIGLLTTFRKDWVGDTDTYIYFANTALTLLLLSFISGLIVQHRIMVRPLHLTHQLEKLPLENDEDWDGEPIEFRRTPDMIERIAYNIQYLIFYAAVFFTVAYALLNINQST